MDIIFWRHAEAEDLAAGISDAQRPLTAKGRRQAKQMAGWLRPRLPADCRVFVSPAVRARETASALKMPFETEPAIGPLAAAGDLLAVATQAGVAGTVVLVGHQPRLGDAIRALLLGGETVPGSTGLSVRKGALWWLRVDGAATSGAKATVRVVLAPEFLA